jgi:basic membrane lipoprotein Med (substrate-binding protein (PBP1-ABC) superfamily)
MKYKNLFLIALICCVAFALTGCHETPASQDHSKIRVGIVFDIGGKDDRSFNAAAWQGVQRAAKDLPIVLRDIEPGTPNAIEPAMRAFAERNFDLIIGVGFRAGADHGNGREGLSEHSVCYHRRRQQVAKRRVAHLQGT